MADQTYFEDVKEGQELPEIKIQPDKQQLVKFAAMCGIGSSARMLATRTGAMANLLRTQAPDELITHIARHRIAHPGSRLIRAHIFAFGGVLKAARWVNAVVAGSFELDREATGFTVSDVG